MKEEKEIISEYFNNYYPQKRTIVLNEVAEEIAGTLSGGANIAGSAIGFGALALVALIIYFLIRDKKPDYGYVTGNVRNSGTYDEMTSTLDQMIAGKNSSQDQTELENYKKDLEQFKKEDQRIIDYLQRISKLDQTDFQKDTISGIKDLSEILLKIQSNKNTADEEIRVRKIVLDIQKNNPKSAILQKICTNILDSLKNKEEIINKATGYQKLILKLSTKYPKIPKKFLSRLMFLNEKEADDLLKKAAELENNKEKIKEFLAGKPIPFVIEKKDDETGINIKISFNDKKQDGKISLGDKIEIAFDNTKLNSKFIPKDLIIEEDKDKFLLNFVELQNSHQLFYKKFLETFNGEIAELKNFKPSPDNLKDLKSLLLKYIDPNFLKKISEYQESSEETQDKNADFKGELDSQINVIIKNVLDFVNSEIKRFKSETLEKPNLSKTYALNEIIKQIKNLRLYKKQILFINPSNKVEKEYNSFFEQDMKGMISDFIKACKAKITDLKILSLPDDAKETVEKLELEKKVKDEKITELLQQIKDSKEEIKKRDQIINDIQPKNNDAMSDLIISVDDLAQEADRIEQIIDGENTQTSEVAETPEKPLIEKLKNLDREEGTSEIIQNITLDIKNKKFTSNKDKTDSYIKFLKNGKLEVYSKKPIDELNIFTDKAFAFEAEEGYKLVFTGQYSINKNKINIYKLKLVEETAKAAPPEKESKILNTLKKYKELLEKLYQDSKKYKDLNDGQKRLINLIDHRNIEIKKIKDDSIQKITSEIDAFIGENGSSRDLKDIPDEDFFINLDKEIEKIDVEKISEKDYPEGAPKITEVPQEVIKKEPEKELIAQDTKSDMIEDQTEDEIENKVEFSDGKKWTTSELYSILMEDLKENQEIKWDTFCYYIEIKNKKITIFKDDTDVKDFYIIIRNRKPEQLPFEIYKKNKDAETAPFDNDYLYQEAKILKKIKERISLASSEEKIYSRKDQKIYEGDINIEKDKITFSNVKTISKPEKKETVKIKEVATKKIQEIVLTASEKLSKLFKFLDPKTSKEEKDTIVNEIPELFDGDIIDLDAIEDLKDELEVETPQELSQIIVPTEQPIEGNVEQDSNKKLEFSNSDKLMLDKDFNITTDEGSAIIFGYDPDNKNIWIDNRTGETNFFISSKNVGSNLSTNLNLFFDKDKKFDDNKTNLILSDATPKGEPKDIKIEISKKDKFKKTNLKQISFIYKKATNESYKDIKDFFQEIFIKEIKKSSFYFEQDVEVNKEISEIKSIDDLIDFLFPSNVYLIDLDVGNKIQQINDFSNDTFEQLKNGVIFYKKKNEDFYRGQLKIADLSIFDKNEDLLKTYFDFNKDNKNLKTLVSEAASMKHPDILSGLPCQVKIDAITSVKNDGTITTNYNISVIKRGTVSSDKFLEKVKTSDKDLISKIKNVVKKDLEEKPLEKPEEIKQKEEITPPKEEVSSEQYFISLDDIKNKKKKVTDNITTDIGIIFTKNEKGFSGYLWIKQLNKVDDLIGFNEIIALKDYFNFSLQDFIITEEIKLDDYKDGFISDDSLTVNIINNEITTIISKGNIIDKYYTDLEKSKQELLKTEIEKTNKEAAYKKFGLTDLLIREKATEKITESPTGFIAKKEIATEGFLIPKNYININKISSNKDYKVYYYIKNGDDYYYIDVDTNLFYILNTIIKNLKFFFGTANTLITIDKEIASSEIKLKDLKTILKATSIQQDKNIKQMKFKFGKIEEKKVKGNKTFFKFPINTSMQPKIEEAITESFDNIIIKNIWKKQ